MPQAARCDRYGIGKKKSSRSNMAMIGALWVGARQFLHERSGLPPPSLAPPSPLCDDPIRTTHLLLDRVYSLIPWAFRPSDYLWLLQEGFPVYYGQTPVSSHAVPANSLLAIFPPTSPLPRTLYKFQSLMSRPPNCFIQFKLCSCGSIHGFLTWYAGQMKLQRSSPNSFHK